MKSINDYAEATLNYVSSRKEFIQELCSILDISQKNIKNVEMKLEGADVKFKQSIIIELIGSIELKSSDVAKIEGLSIITPSTLVINVGEIDL